MVGTLCIGVLVLIVVVGLSQFLKVLAWYIRCLCDDEEYEGDSRSRVLYDNKKMHSFVTIQYHGLDVDGVPTPPCSSTMAQRLLQPYIVPLVGITQRPTKVLG